MINRIIIALSCVLIVSCSKTETITPSTPSIPTTPTTNTSTYNPLWVPPILNGSTFNLSLEKATKQLQAGAKTNTYGFNGNDFWGPTLIMNKGDNVTLNVTNKIDETTTVHWHGFHIPANMDGGPHQTIAPNVTWSPNFKIMNNAGTYWYHPHAHELTHKQLAYGAGGFIIIKDPQEAALNLPRTYGVDDIPLMLTSRRYSATNVIDIAGAYGDYQLTNGISSSQITLPKSFVRFRILNAEIERGYILGFSDNRTFYVIGNDGGLVNSPVAVTRLPLMVGERAEIMVDLGGDAIDSAIDLKAFNSGQPLGFGGGEPATSGVFGSLLNDKDFNLLNIKVGAAGASAVKTMPGTLANNTYWTNSDVTNSRTITITGGLGGQAFTLDNKAYSHTTINQIVKLNAVEKWTIVNNNIFGHSFHIHDVQFKVISRSNGAVAPYESGWKDTVYVPIGTSVSVIAKFDDFSSPTDAFMYHCHFSNHEDEGMMGNFVVIP